MLLTASTLELPNVDLCASELHPFTFEYLGEDERARRNMQLAKLDCASFVLRSISPKHHAKRGASFQTRAYPRLLLSNPVDVARL